MAQVAHNLTLTEILGAIGAARKPFFRAWNFAPQFIQAVMAQNRDAIKALAIEANDTDITVNAVTQKALNNADKNAIVALCDQMNDVPVPEPSSVWSEKSRAKTNLPDGSMRVTITFQSNNGQPDVVKAFQGPAITNAAVSEWSAQIIHDLDVRDAAAAGIP